MKTLRDAIKSVTDAVRRNKDAFAISNRAEAGGLQLLKMYSIVVGSSKAIGVPNGFIIVAPIDKRSLVEMRAQIDKILAEDN